MIELQPRNSGAQISVYLSGSYGKLSWWAKEPRRASWSSRITLKHKDSSFQSEKKLSRCVKKASIDEQETLDNSKLLTTPNTNRKYTEGRSRDRLPRMDVVTLPELVGMQLGRPNLNWSWRYCRFWRGYKCIDRKGKAGKNMDLLFSEGGS